MLFASARFVALLGSRRRPEQRQQLQWPIRLHQCDRNELRRLLAAKAARGAPGAGAPAVASTIAAALELDVAAACASRPLLAAASCASVRCLLRFVICRVQASWKHKCFGNDC